MAMSQPVYSHVNEHGVHGILDTGASSVHAPSALDVDFDLSPNLQDPCERIPLPPGQQDLILRKQHITGRWVNLPTNYGK